MYSLSLVNSCQNDTDTLFQTSTSLGLTLNPFLRFNRSTSQGAQVDCAFHINNEQTIFHNSAVYLDITVDNKLKFH